MMKNRLNKKKFRQTFANQIILSAFAYFLSWFEYYFLGIFFKLMYAFCMFKVGYSVDLVSLEFFFYDLCKDKILNLLIGFEINVINVYRV